MLENIPSAPPPPETIRKRYGFTLLTRLVQLFFSAMTTFIVPRALGPAVFGNYSFLMGTAGTVRGMSELSTQQSFFTFSAKSHQSGPLSKLYAMWVVFQLFLSVAFIGLARVTGFLPKIWIGQHLNQIVIVTILEWLIFVALSLQQLGDSKGLTIYSQKVIALAAGLNALTIVALAYLKWLTFYTYVLTLMIVNVGSCLAFGYFLFVTHRSTIWMGNPFPDLRANIRRWWVYASPLVVFGFYASLLSWIDNYLIQRFYGSSEQGYFAASSQIAKVVLIFTSSAVTIYWRELSFHTHAGNTQRAAQIYLRFSRALYFMTLVLSVWVCFTADVIIPRLMGPQYLASIPILMVMAFYPLQQTFGQLNTVALLALEKTKSYRNFGVALSLPGLLLTYFLLAPRTARIPGLGLGALGVALKNVVYGLVSVQFYEWYVCRVLNISYPRLLTAKSINFIGIGTLGYVILFAMRHQVFDHWRPGTFTGIVVSSIGYWAILGIIGLRWPEVMGLQRDDIRVLILSPKEWFFKTVSKK